MIYGLFYTYTSKIEAILHSDPIQIKDRERSGQSRITKGHILESKISNKKCVFLGHFYLRIPKMLFVFLYKVQKCSKLQFKNDAINDYGFWSICKQK